MNYQYPSREILGYNFSLKNYKIHFFAKRGSQKNAIYSTCSTKRYCALMILLGGEV